MSLGIDITALARCCRCISQQVLCLVAVLDTNQTVVIKQWRIVQSRYASCGSSLSESISTINLIGIVMTGEVDGCHIWICLTWRNVSFYLLVGQFFILCQICSRVEVCNAHYLRTIVSRCTIYAVGIAVRRQTTFEACHSRRQILMRMRVIAVGQLLAEEDVVVGPDGIELLGIFSIVTLVLGCGDFTSRIAEVAILEAVFNVTEVAVCSIAACGIESCRSLIGTSIVVIECPVLIFLSCALVSALIVTFVQVEAVKIISNLTIVEGLSVLCCGNTMSSGSRLIGLSFLIIAVDKLDRTLNCNFC